MQDFFHDPADSARLVDIARKWGTPTYVYFDEVIRERCQILSGLFPGLPVSWLYAVKANDNPYVLKIIQEEGLGFDTVSYEEVLLCRKLNTDPGNIFYTENNMTDAEMQNAVAEGVVLNIGSPGRLKAFCETNQGASCSIRLKPDISDGHHAKVDTGNEDSKFGIRMDLIADVIQLADSHNVSIRGIHAHIGSGIQNPENLLSEIIFLLNAAKEFNKLEFINFGGGIPIPYRLDEPMFDLDGFAKHASVMFQNFLMNINGNIRFYFEPGRWIIGPAGILLTQVNTVKDQGRKKFLGTDTGFNHLLRPALYNAWHEMFNITAEEGAGLKVYDIAGNICESGDILGFERSLPETNPGDILAIRDAGAYGMTMASTYNRRALPAEVLVSGKNSYKIIRKRKSADEAVNDFLLETGYTDEATS